MSETREIRPGFEVIEVTPEIAAQWLELNKSNYRSLRKRWVQQLAGAMERGEWEFNGDPIRFTEIDGDMALVDGQHRLTAVVKSGVTIHSLVMRGASRKSVETMDTGKARGAGDVLRARHYTNVNVLASIARRLVMWQGTGDMYLNQPSPTVQQIVSLVEHWPELPRSASAAAAYRITGVSNAALGACHALFSVVDKDEADEFLHRLRYGVSSDGKGMDEGDAIYALRRQLERLTASRHSGLPAPGFIAAVVIIAWNKWQAGDSVQVIAYRRGGSKPQPFPQVRGLDETRLPALRVPPASRL